MALPPEFDWRPQAAAQLPRFSRDGGSPPGMRTLSTPRPLQLTDPRDDRKRIEQAKGGLLLEGSYRWVLQNPQFKQWRDSRESHLLWIQGDPGKGKTMLLCGIVNELREVLRDFAHQSAEDFLLD